MQPPKMYLTYVKISQKSSKNNHIFGRFKMLGRMGPISRALIFWFIFYNWKT